MDIDQHGNLDGCVHHHLFETTLCDDNFHIYEAVLQYFLYDFHFYGVFRQHHLQRDHRRHKHDDPG